MVGITFALLEALSWTFASSLGNFKLEQSKRGFDISDILKENVEVWVQQIAFSLSSPLITRLDFQIKVNRFKTVSWRIWLIIHSNRLPSKRYSSLSWSSSSSLYSSQAIVLPKYMFCTIGQRSSLFSLALSTSSSMISRLLSSSKF